MDILLVDPSTVSRTALCALFEREGHTVTTCSDHEQAVQIYLGDPSIDAVIASQESYGRAGLDLIRRIRAVDAERFVYVIAMSTCSERESMVAALDCGANDFIRKPASAHELYARLRSAERFTAVQRQLLDAAMTDPLTAIMNRRGLQRRVAQIVEQVRAVPITAVMFDIDHFKAINDRHGHGVGDRIIVAVADEVRARTELVARLGGEEFVAILVGQDALGGLDFAETLRQTIAARRFGNPGDEFAVTCSFGVQAVEPGMDLEAVLSGADMALYAAKAAGRNRVMVAGTRPACATASPDDARPVFAA